MNEDWRIGELKAGFEKHNDYYPEYSKKLLKLYRGYQKWARVFFPFLRPRLNGSTRYIFAGNVSYFDDLIRHLQKDEILVLVTGVRSYIRYRRFGIKAILTIGLFRSLDKLISENRKCYSKIELSMRLLEKIFRQSQASFLFVQSDAMPYERLIVSSARNADVITVCVQHGLFSHDTPDNLVEGRFCDVFLAYDEAQAQIVSGQSAANRVIASGNLRDSPASMGRTGARTICFIGQPYPLLFPDKTEIYLDTVNTVIELCDGLGIAFVYKSHPGEAGSDYLANIPGVREGGMDEFFSLYDCFVGVSSTVLHQASCLQKVAIQLFNDRLVSDRLEDHGYCYSLSLEQFVAAGDGLLKLKNYKSNAIALFTKGSLGSRWEGAMQELVAMDFSDNDR